MKKNKTFFLALMLLVTVFFPQLATALDTTCNTHRFYTSGSDFYCDALWILAGIPVPANDWKCVNTNFYMNEGLYAIDSSSNFVRYPASNCNNRLVFAGGMQASKMWVCGNEVYVNLYTPNFYKILADGTTNYNLAGGMNADKVYCCGDGYNYFNVSTGWYKTAPGSAGATSVGSPYCTTEVIAFTANPPCKGTQPSGAGVTQGPNTPQPGGTMTWTYDAGATTSTPCKWKCNTGYIQSGNTCVVSPSSSSSSSSSSSTTSTSSSSSSYASSTSSSSSSSSTSSVSRSVSSSSSSTSSSYSAASSTSSSSSSSSSTFFAGNSAASSSVFASSTSSSSSSSSTSSVSRSVSSSSSSTSSSSSFAANSLVSVSSSSSSSTSSSSSIIFKVTSSSSSSSTSSSSSSIAANSLVSVSSSSSSSTSSSSSSIFKVTSSSSSSSTSSSSSSFANNSLVSVSSSSSSSTSSSSSIIFKVTSSSSSSSTSSSSSSSASAATTNPTYPDYTGKISTVISAPRYVMPGVLFDARIYVWNLYNSTINNIPVTLYTPSELVISGSPSQTIPSAPVNSYGVASYKVQSGSLGSYAVNASAFNQVNDSKTVVVKNPASPLCSITLVTPPVMNAGVNYTVVSEIFNYGDATANTVTWTAELSPGLTSSDQLIRLLGNLPPSSSQQQTLTVTPISGGLQYIYVEISNPSLDCNDFQENSIMVLGGPSSSTTLASTTTTTLSGVPPISDMYLDIGNDSSMPWEWGQNRLFIGPEKTPDFSARINQILYSNCNCNGCLKVGSNCTIPLVFHTNIPGYMGVSNLTVTYESNTILHSVGYGEAFKLSDGCIWTIENSNSVPFVVKVPESYTGVKTCTYTTALHNLTTDDAMADAMYRLLSQTMDVSHDGKIDEYFNSSSMSFQAHGAINIQSLWGPAVVKVIVWI